MTIISWFGEDDGAPDHGRRYLGEVQGTMTAAAPTARPNTTRNSTNTPTLGARAAPMAPTAKVIAAMIVRLRLPSRSESGPALPAPTGRPEQERADHQTFEERGEPQLLGDEQDRAGDEQGVVAE